MKRLLVYAILSIAIGCIVILVINTDTTNDKRIAYESFLNSSYQNAPEVYTDTGKKEMEMANPEMAAFQNYFMTLDPKLKRVPIERLKIAKQKTAEIKQAALLKNSANEIRWNSIPANMGGRTRAFMYDPNDPNGKKVWAGAVTGGLWSNDDISNIESSWSPNDNFWGSQSISTITYDPNNSTHFYIGTGEVETARIIYRESSSVGSGHL